MDRRTDLVCDLLDARCRDRVLLLARIRRLAAAHGPGAGRPTHRRCRDRGRRRRRAGARPVAPRALVLLRRRRHGASAVAVALAGLLKLTAWPLMFALAAVGDG